MPYKPLMLRKHNCMYFYLFCTIFSCIFAAVNNKKYYNKLVHTPRWLMLRRQKLTENPTCQRCEEEGRQRFATEVHHVIPVEDGRTLQEMQRLAYDIHNLKSLCHECHVKTHTEMGRSGKAYAERKNKTDIQRFTDKFL